MKAIKWYFLLCFLTISLVPKAQWWSITGNTGTSQTTNYIGTTDNQGLSFRTNAFTRMRISSAGYVGINNAAPFGQLHITGRDFSISRFDASIVLQAGGLNRGSAIYFSKDGSDVDCQNHMFIGGPSTSSGAEGNYFICLRNNFDSTSYTQRNVMQFYGQTNFGQPLIQDVRFFREVLVDTNVGIRTLFPTNPLDVNGTTRIRNVPANTSQVLITGVQQSGVGDYVINRLAFTGNANQVLLGNGTWGNALSSLTANNGLIINPTGNVQLGQTTCTATGSGQLTRNTYIPLNNFNLVFNDNGSLQNYLTNRIGIGTCSPLAKVDIVRPQIGPNETNPLALRVQNADIAGLVQGTGTANGAEITCTGPNRWNRALYVRATNAEDNIGLWAEAAPASGTTWSTIGVNAKAENGGINRGVYGWAGSSIGVESQNTGVAGYAGGASLTNIGIAGTVATGPGGQPNNCAGYFNGDVFTTSSSYYTSDSRIKKDSKIYAGGLNILDKLNVYSYQFDLPYGGINLPEGRQIGIMAQELEQLLPNLVKGKILLSYDTTVKESLQIKAVNYTGLIPVTIQAIKELNSKFTEVERMEVELSTLQQKYDELYIMFNQLCTEGCAGVTKNSLPSESRLYQNVPNPYLNTTKISYVLSSNTKDSYLNISNLEGNIIKRYSLLKGSTSIDIDTTEFGSGSYSYSLYVDGRLIDTKKMVKIR